MTIKIPLKLKPSSNKSQTTPQTSHESTTVPPEGYPDPTSLIPFMDKISVVLTPPDVVDAADIYGAVFTQTKDKDVFKTAFFTGTAKGNQRAWRVVITSQPNDKKWPLLQMEYDKKTQLMTRLRVEFSPVDLGAKGMEEFHLNLTSLMPDGWGYFLKHGFVTTIEVTVDVPGVRIEDFHVLPSQALTTRTFKRDGKLETLVMGQSKGNQTKVYNRKQKRITKGQSWSGPETTRIERRLRLGNTQKLSDISELPNAFGKLGMVFLTADCPPSEKAIGKSYLWTLFTDSVQVRNLTCALRLLPASKKKTYRQWLDQHPTKWWQPETIWSHWKAVVQSSGLLFPIN